VPTISSATLNYGTGVLVITASKPITLVDGTLIHISDVSGSNDVTYQEVNLPVW